MSKNNLALIALLFVISSGTANAALVHSVRPHFARSGKFVPGHMQTDPDHTKIDNWSTTGNVNPFTGRRGHRKLVSAE